MSRPTGFTAGELTVHNGPAELRAVTRALRATGRRIVLVPTMGALHAGHRELIRRARRIPNTVTVVSIFVNPLQFGKNEDLDHYPRTFDDDLVVCMAEGVELVFAPSTVDMYDIEADITVQPGQLGTELEGASRPGHFAGVLTVVAKLFNVVCPDLAFFGEKDYQQLMLIRRMVRELDFDVQVVGVPIIRDEDGLAHSSRNGYLTAQQRRAALALPSALVAGAQAAASGPEAVLEAALAVLAAEPEVAVDYLELRDRTLGPVSAPGEARLLVAARVGPTRLIDNVPVLLGSRLATETIHESKPSNASQQPAVPTTGGQAQ